MAGDSSVQGYIVPTGAEPLEDDQLDDFFQAVVVGITGLEGRYVRPRWQRDPPNLPPDDVNWAAVGVTHRSTPPFAVEDHDPAGEGSNSVTRHEDLDLLCSFYGPKAQSYGARLRDGVCVAQNREELDAAGMGLIEVGDLTKAPELVKNRWLQRADLTVRVRREVRRTYPVLNLTSALVQLHSETATAEVVVNP